MKGALAITTRTRTYEIVWSSPASWEIRIRFLPLKVGKKRISIQIEGEWQPPLPLKQQLQKKEPFGRLLSLSECYDHALCFAHSLSLPLQKPLASLINKPPQRVVSKFGKRQKGEKNTRACARLSRHATQGERRNDKFKRYPRVACPLSFLCARTHARACETTCSLRVPGFRFGTDLCRTSIFCEPPKVVNTVILFLKFRYSDSTINGSFIAEKCYMSGTFDTIVTRLSICISQI